jgi:hypothetical protein
VKGQRLRNRVGRTIALAAATGVIAATMASAGTASTLARSPGTPRTHWPINPLVGVRTTGPQASFKNVKGLICTTSSNAANVNTDCESGIHNETTIAINPTDGTNEIGSANDYQLRLSPGGTVYLTTYSRAHVTFDGGTTWKTYPIDFRGYDAISDPAVAFDASGNAYLSSVGFGDSQGLGCCTNPDVLVTHSADGGITWSPPSHVAAGHGSFGSVGVFNDKPYLTAWGNGNAIVAWTRLDDGKGGTIITARIFASVTHDGGATWSTPADISGSAAFCVGTQGGTACNLSFAATPAVGADGSVYVAFLNTSRPDGRDQYLVVKVDPTTGHLLAGPYRVGLMYDGFTDYPINIDDTSTLQDSQFRTSALGNLAADPTAANHLAIAWSDMRNSTLPAPADPYTATTNSDVIVSQSTDGGATWSGPAAVTRARDQFMPWSAYDSAGKLRIGFFDRSYDADNHEYGYTLATETSPGNLTFGFSQLTTALSDPTQGDRWFSGITPNPDFPNPTTFLGDYSGIAATSSVSALWTDMRRTACFGSQCGFGEDAFFAAAP